ncbi:uncharacterized protein PGTG_00213 [Puccinia graminis f. sp. tritici CRL 75-36-700-3]|uniref:Uncharacterized protein n=1 Tax=Puccinia graminis f. sp. tritici (strain CRL 75-36-700-3 / race SCCL) TaxID=418459 RepID=E3JRG8_PUCGT|nr:uncharacterized protein PGTG_00213 [Puccinia graminis f. sp. tritici CRL 75-36-700-3]EFP74257.1 hypothetical protein PGTG_00213 [Puccinia graminis f. sp. tritici CRL 75-36-700-3]
MSAQPPSASTNNKQHPHLSPVHHTQPPDVGDSAQSSTLPPARRRQAEKLRKTHITNFIIRHHHHHHHHPIGLSTPRVDTRPGPKSFGVIKLKDLKYGEEGEQTQSFVSSVFGVCDWRTMVKAIEFISVRSNP